MKNLILLRAYIYIWLVYFSILFLLPATIISGDALLSYAVLLLFISITVTVFILLLAFPGGGSKRLVMHDCHMHIVSLVNYAVLMSILSAIFILYDRVYIQLIDYTGSIAIAREEWKYAADSRQGFSSIYSVFGNILSGFPIVLAALLFYSFEELKSSRRLFASLISIVTLMVLVVLSGGRSIIMMFLLSLFLVGLLRKCRGKRFVPVGFGLFKKSISLFIGISFIAYSLYIFHLRAIVGGNTSTSYLISTLNHLGGVGYDWVYVESTTVFESILDYLYLVGAYLVHSAWTLQSILELDSYSNTGFVTFNFYRVNIARVAGLESAPEEWAFSGLFSSYPGAFYYDYGLLGMIIGACIVGGLLFISTVISRLNRLNPLLFGVYLSSMYVVLLSPLLFAADVMSFPFILFDFIILHFIWLYKEKWIPKLRQQLIR